MKDLLNYLYEEGAAPLNTLGMGNPMAPTDNQVGTEPITPLKKKKKCKKQTSESLLDDEDEIMNNTSKAIKYSNSIFGKYKFGKIGMLGSIVRLYKTYCDKKGLNDLMYDCLDKLNKGPVLRGLVWDELYNIIGCQEFNSNDKEFEEYLKKLLQPYFKIKIDVIVRNFTKIKIYEVFIKINGAEVSFEFRK